MKQTRQQYYNLRWVDNEIRQLQAELQNREEQNARHAEGAVGPTDVAYNRAILNMLQKFKKDLNDGKDLPRPTPKEFRDVGEKAIMAVPYDVLKRFNIDQHRAEIERTKNTIK